jgi:peptidoglycan/LPS O-acetylase OafA/YrhL
VGAASMGLAAFAVLSLGATLIAASLSWVIVERPALRLKRVVPPRALSPTGS